MSDDARLHDDTLLTARRPRPARRITASSTRRSTAPRPCSSRPSRPSRGAAARASRRSLRPQRHADHLRAARRRSPRSKAAARAVTVPLRPGRDRRRRCSAFLQGRRPPADGRQRLRADPHALRRRARRASASRRPTTIPLIGAGIAGLIRPEHDASSTSRAPGSLTFEVQDVPAIAAAAHARAAPWCVIDNTWATPLYFKPLAHGVDIVDPRRDQVHRRPFRRRCWASSRRASEPWRTSWRRRPHDLGHLRRRRTTAIWRCAACAPCRCAWSATRRPRSSSRAGCRRGRRSRACSTRPCPSDPGHALWKRDFTGAAGLFAVRAEAVPEAGAGAPCSTAWSCSAWATAGAATRA